MENRGRQLAGGWPGSRPPAIPSDQDGWPKGRVGCSLSIIFHTKLAKDPKRNTPAGELSRTHAVENDRRTRIHPDFPEGAADTGSR
jgi:hypothetical protein